MAIIDSVKLPDNSTYEVADNNSGYAKKVAGATTDDLASLTATGDLADSGKKLGDLVLKADVKDVLNSTSTTDPLSANQGRVLKDNIDDDFSGQSDKNFLDNPFFTVNQRNTSGSYQNGYMADRWFAAGFTSSNVTTNITNNGAVIQSNGTYGWRVKQNIENYKDLSGRKVTYSINVKSISSDFISLLYAPSLNGINEDWVWLGNVSTTGIASVTFTLPDLSSASGLCLMFQSDTPIDVTIRAVKLEPGSVSTLAHDVAPNHAFELAKCQTSTADPSDTYANQGQLMTRTLVATATGDGVKTWAQVISEVTSNYNPGEFYKYCIVKDDINAYYPMNRYSFVQVDGADTGDTSMYFRIINPDLNKNYEANNTFALTDYSSYVFSNGSTLKLYKMG